MGLPPVQTNRDPLQYTVARKGLSGFWQKVGSASYVGLLVLFKTGRYVRQLSHHSYINPLQW
jgi:hypothetical protein